MSIAIQSEKPPLIEDEHGAIRVGGSRVLLDLVVHAFQDGAAPETIVQQYPSLSLSDTYAAVAYYLRHKTEVESYLASREAQAQSIRAKVESTQPDLTEIRNRLNTRRGR